MPELPEVETARRLIADEACGAEMRHGTVGGRSTWWCSREQESMQLTRSA